MTAFTYLIVTIQNYVDDDIDMDHIDVNLVRYFHNLPHYMCALCSDSVVVTAYDSESGRPGSNPEWGAIYYEASISVQGLPEPSSLWDGYQSS